ncbi:MAG TPA: TIGR01777 family oxidoreductase [Candidatus Eremiobacteraceae bacterium]|nr:TIGR01777 family oxidoreductase [Candidatus Eremiobacteraceae bacterium]
MKKVAVTGASGFVGRAVVAALARRGDRVTALGRRVPTDGLPTGVRAAKFDPNNPTPHPEIFEGLDAVINLAGETVDGRWNAEKKRAIYDSRVLGTRNLVASLSKCTLARPAVLVNASAVGFYGSRGDDVLDESSSPGQGFLADLVRDWEAAADRAEPLGMRVAKVRIAFVLGEGGAVGKLLPPFKAFIGGPFGNGRMWFPWMHLDDTVALILLALDRDDAVGPINAVSPDIATNMRFVQALGHAIERPAIMPVPPPALKLILGEFADTVLGSQLILPRRAQELGFHWKHEMLEEALLDVLAPGSGRTPATHEFTSELVVPRPIGEVWRFLSDPASVARCTPPSYRLDMAGAIPRINQGATIDYTVRVNGVTVKWRTLVTGWEVEERFVDYQVRGPFALWRHCHEFAPGPGGGTVVRDRVRYSIPWAPLGDVALPLVRRDLSEIWAYRRHKISELLS